MSLNRENVIWQSQDGTWNRGFFTFYAVGDACAEDYDHEWDVEYDNGTFHWVSTGHATEAAADASWRGPNPGSGEVCRFTEANAADCAAYDAMAASFKAEQAAARAALPASRPRW